MELAGFRCILFPTNNRVAAVFFQPQTPEADD